MCWERFPVGATALSVPERSRRGTRGPGKAEALQQPWHHRGPSALAPASASSGSPDAGRCSERPAEGRAGHSVRPASPARPRTPGPHTGSQGLAGGSTGLLTTSRLSRGWDFRARCARWVSKRTNRTKRGDPGLRAAARTHAHVGRMGPRPANGTPASSEPDWRVRQSPDPKAGHVLLVDKVPCHSSVPVGWCVSRSPQSSRQR